MLESPHIEVGQYYVNEEGHTVRRILEISSQIVVYSSFDLSNGNLSGIPYRLCTQSDIIHWADREATTEEIQGLRFAWSQVPTRRSIRSKPTEASPGSSWRP